MDLVELFGAIEPELYRFPAIEPDAELYRFPAVEPDALRSAVIELAHGSAGP